MCISLNCFICKLFFYVASISNTRLTLGLGFAGMREAYQQFQATACMSYSKGVARGNNGSLGVPMTSHLNCNRCVLLLGRSGIWKAATFR